MRIHEFHDGNECGFRLRIVAAHYGDYFLYKGQRARTGEFHFFCKSIITLSER